MPTQPNTSFVMNTTEQEFVKNHFDGSKSAAIHAGLTRLMEENMNIRIRVNMDGFYGEDWTPGSDEKEEATLWKSYVGLATDALGERFPGTDVSIEQGVENPMHGTEIDFDWPGNMQGDDGSTYNEYADRQAEIGTILEDAWDRIW